MERWLPIEGWEGIYEVSDLGRVRRMVPRHPNGKQNRPYVRSPSPRANGYVFITLRLQGRRPEQRGVAPMVLTAFVGPRPPGMQVCHGNGVRSDNRLENLRWDSVTANAADRHRHGRLIAGERHPGARLTDAKAAAIIDALAHGRSGRSLAEEYGVGTSTISAIAHNQTWKHIPRPSGAAARLWIEPETVKVAVPPSGREERLNQLMVAMGAGPRTTQDLAAEMGVSDVQMGAILRRHERAGLVRRTGLQRGKQGHPSILWDRVHPAVSSKG